MKNYAGRNDVDYEISKELETAGIHYVLIPEFMRNETEVKTIVRGNLHEWLFRREWRYWIAIGPGMPFMYAMKLYENFGNVVRVDGNCSCPSPEKYNGFSVNEYHIDTQEGLNAFAKILNEVISDFKKTGI